jgi:hypothetical protein
VLLEAFALLATRGVAFTVDLIGQGDQEEPCGSASSSWAWNRACGCWARGHGNGDGTRRRRGGRPGRSLRRGSDGDRDSLPPTVLEAMALGTPCVSTDVTGIPEVVRHGETGLLVPQNDAAALADALQLLADAALRVELARHARRRIGDFDARVNGATLRQLMAERTVRRRGADRGQPGEGPGAGRGRRSVKIAPTSAPTPACRLPDGRAARSTFRKWQALCVRQAPTSAVRRPPGRPSTAALAGVPRQRLPAHRGGTRGRSARRWTPTVPLQEALQASGPFDAVYERYALWSFAGMEYARDAGTAGLLEVNAPLIEEQARHRELVHREAAEAATERAVAAASRLITVSEPLAEWVNRRPVRGDRCM